MSTIEQRTGTLFGRLWGDYDDELFVSSMELFAQRWAANDEAPDYFHGKRCLDAGCGGGRYALAMARLGASSVVGIDVGAEGLTDATRRRDALKIENATFRPGSVLDIPFDDATFDFVVCSGVLHHTPDAERGLRELARVTKPGGEVFVLLYGAGGLYWPLTCLMRSIAQQLGIEEVDRCVGTAGIAANKRRTVLDDLFVPLLETYARERVESLLRGAGFSAWRFWERGRLDHERDPEALIADLRIREQIWRSGAAGASSEPIQRLELSLAEMCRATIGAAEELVRAREEGMLTAADVCAAVIGTGHHRVIATR